MNRLTNLPTLLVIVFAVGLWTGLMLPHLGRKPKRKSAKKDSGPVKIDYWFDVRYNNTRCSDCNSPIPKGARAAKMTTGRVKDEVCARS